MLARVTILSASLFLLSADDHSKDSKEELKKLQGNWTLVSKEMKGNAGSERVVKASRLEIKDDTWRASVGGVTSGSTTKITIDPSLNPKAIDFHLKKGDDEEITHGIYKLEGDTLTICRTVDGNVRPKEFKTTAEDGILYVWKREK